MTHATEGQLLAWVDGEIDDSAAAELSDHLAVCAACAGELSELRRLSASAHAALGLLDASPPMLRARASIAAARGGRGRRLSWAGLSGFARAAMLVLALAGVAAAVVPGSPVRIALEATFARVAEVVQGTPDAEPVPVPAPPTAAPAPSETMGMAILPAAGRVRVVLHAPAGIVDVHVRLVEERRARVETATAQPDVRLRSAAGRIEVIGLTTGEVRIDIPRQVPLATVEIGGVIHVFKEGGRLQLAGPAGSDGGTAVRFRTGS